MAGFVSALVTKPAKKVKLIYTIEYVYTWVLMIMIMIKYRVEA